MLSRIFRVHTNAHRRGIFPTILRKINIKKCTCTQINALFVFSLSFVELKRMAACVRLLCVAAQTWQRKERSELSCSFRSTLKNCLALLFSSSAVAAVREERYGFTCNKQWKRKISFMEFIHPLLSKGKDEFSSHPLWQVLSKGRREEEKRLSLQLRFLFVNFFLFLQSCFLWFARAQLV